MDGQTPTNLPLLCFRYGNKSLILPAVLCNAAAKTFHDEQLNCKVTVTRWVRERAKLVIISSLVDLQQIVPFTEKISLM